MNIIAIDNGCTGSIAILDEQSQVVLFEHTPTFESRNYTKEERYIHRINTEELYTLLRPYSGTSKCVIERPMINIKRFRSSVSAIRAFEATSIVLERLSIPYEVVDSKKWQHVILPSNVWEVKLSKSGRKKKKVVINMTLPKSKRTESGTLKQAGIDYVKTIYPSLKLPVGVKDCDAVCMAIYYKNLSRGQGL